MGILRTIPSKKLINGEFIETSEVAVISESEYKTSGEGCIVVRNVLKSVVILDSTTTDHIVIKSMTDVTIKPDVGKIDEEFDEVVADKYACIEFRFCAGNWYVISSDGLKNY